MAKENEQFSTLVNAIEHARLSAPLNEKGPLTVFAPTNDAFQNMGISTNQLSELFKAENNEKLKKIILMHIVKGVEINVHDIIDGETRLKTAGGEKITLWKKDGTITINPGGAKIIATDIKAKNGVIQGIDKLIHGFPIRKQGAHFNLQSKIGYVLIKELYPLKTNQM